MGLRAGLSDVLVSSTGAPQGTPLFSIVGFIGDDSEAECRALVERFVGRCGTDRLQLSVGETKELVVDYLDSLVAVGEERTRRNLGCFYFYFYFLCVCLIPIPVVLHFTSLSYLILFSSSSQSHV